MTSFRCSLTRFFGLAGRDRYLYTELSARMTRDKIRTITVDDDMEAELEELLGGSIAPPLLHLEEKGIISYRIIDGGWFITPLPEPELVPKKSAVIKKPEEGEWKALAEELIIGAGQTPSDNYTASVLKELLALEAPIERARLLTKSVNKSKINSVGGWVRTCGMALINNVIKLDSHVMYKRYELPETTGAPASKSEVKKALEKMKGIVDDAKNQ